MNNMILGLLAGALVYTITKVQNVIAPPEVTLPPVGTPPVLPVPSGVANPLPVTPPIITQPPIVVNNPPPIIPSPIVIPSSGLGVFWDEDFEDVNAVQRNWNESSLSCPGLFVNIDGGACMAYPAISTDMAYSGSRSLHYRFRGHQQGHIDGGARAVYGLPEWPKWGGYNAIRHCPPTQDVWLRWMEYVVPGFVCDEIGTKSNGITLSNGGYLWLGLYTGRGPGGTGGGVYSRAEIPDWVPSLNRYDYRELPNYAIPVGRWFCIEFHLRVNDAGQKNGVFEAYIDGVKQVGISDWAFGDINRQLPLSVNDFKWNGIKIYVQDGWGDLYRDRIAIGSQRIGAP